MARRLGFSGALDVDRMIAAARRKTGLSHFGDEWFLEPLEVLVRSINDEARLTPLGTRIQHSRIVSALAIRLRAEELLRENPDILDIHLGKIILIAGLQRTATTTLHRLIAADPRIRALRSWEALNPVPLRGERKGIPGAVKVTRRWRLERSAIWRRSFSPFIPSNTTRRKRRSSCSTCPFMSQAPEALMHVPSYSRWLEEQDHTKCYEYMFTLLKILHRQHPGNYWVLKTPHHMEYLDVVLDVLPDVRIVQTHRDPGKSIPSFCSMVAHGRSMLSDHVDPEEIGAHWLRKTRRMMERSMSARRIAGDDVVVDVSYYDLVTDPLGELRGIYRAAGIDFTSETENAAKAVSRRNVRNRHGRHVYSLASFGLDDETIDECCDSYRREYGIPDETATRRGK